MQQQTQQTNVSNNYYNVVSALYHALKTAQTSTTYLQDAQQSGNQELVSFFQQIQQDANRHADQAKRLLDRINA